MKIIICPDKFRGSLNAQNVSEAIQSGIIKATNNLKSQPLLKVQKVQIEIIPLADGGQGSVQIISQYYAQNQMKKQKQFQSRWIEVQAFNPIFKKIKTKYLLVQVLKQKKSIVFIQSALIIGLSLLQKNQRNPQQTSTYGVGQLIKHALLLEQLNYKIQEIYLFVGGSATNDGGVGVLEALGYEIYGNFYQEVQLIQQRISHFKGKDLIRLTSIKQNFSNQKQGAYLLKRIKQTKIIICTDVKNCLTGENGSAYVYAKQKGATQQQIQRLDRGLKNLVNILDQFHVNFNKSIDQIEGCGASGGLPSSLIGIFNNPQRKTVFIQSGIQKILNIVSFQQKISNQNVQLVITGEGKVDEQTLKGKVVYGVIQKCYQKKLPVWIVCGINQLSEKYPQLQKEIHQKYKNIDIISLVCQETSIEQSMKNTFELIQERVFLKFSNFLNFQI